MLALPSGEIPSSGNRKKKRSPNLAAPSFGSIDFSKLLENDSGINSGINGNGGIGEEDIDPFADEDLELLAPPRFDSLLNKGGPKKKVCMFCMYVCIYVCSVCMYVFVYVCMYVCMP